MNLFDDGVNVNLSLTTETWEREPELEPGLHGMHRALGLRVDGILNGRGSAGEPSAAALEQIMNGRLGDTRHDTVPK
jgi:hypothetical protein